MEGEHVEARLGIELGVGRWRGGDGVGIRAVHCVGTLVGYGSRGSDCHERKLLTVQLRQNRRWWPDKTLAETKFTFTNGQLSVKYPCNGAGVKSVFTKAWLQGETPLQSPAKGFDACG
jgi:hypothetical protein